MLRTTLSKHCPAHLYFINRNLYLHVKHALGPWSSGYCLIHLGLRILNCVGFQFRITGTKTQILHVHFAFLLELSISLSPFRLDYIRFCFCFNPSLQFFSTGVIILLSSLIYSLGISCSALFVSTRTCMLYYPRLPLTEKIALYLFLVICTLTIHHLGIAR